MILTCQKHLFRLDPDIHYLNNAYKSPLLKSGEMAALKALQRGRNPQLISPEDFFSESKLVRTEFAKLLKVQDQNIAIIPSSSYGFATLFLNTKGKINGNAITIGEEFPSGYFALKKWSSKENQELRIVKGNSSLDQQGADWNARILKAIDTDTSVVCLSAIHWATGLKFNLKAIGEKCHKVGAKLFVDGAQTIGALPVDIKGCYIDGLVCAAYKCLFGPYSISLLYVENDFFDGEPLEEAWMNREGAENFSGLSDYNEEYSIGARRYNMGQTSNFILTPILLSGLRQINKWNVNNIQTYCKSLAMPFIDKMKNHGYIFENNEHLCFHLFSIKIGQEKMLTLFDILTAKKLKLSARGTNLRISISVYNDHADLDVLSEALLEL